MNQNEKLTVNWVVEQCKSNKPIVTDEVLRVLKPKRLKRVMKYLERRGILSFTDFINPMVVFIKKDVEGLSVDTEDGYRGGVLIQNNSVMILPITPIQ